jgi:hypothetical protein
MPMPQLLLHDLPEQANNFDHDEHNNLVFQIIKASKVSLSP